MLCHQSALHFQGTGGGIVWRERGTELVFSVVFICKHLLHILVFEYLGKESVNG